MSNHRALFDIVSDLFISSCFWLSDLFIARVLNNDCIIITLNRTSYLPLFTSLMPNITAWKCRRSPERTQNLSEFFYLFELI